MVSAAKCADLLNSHAGSIILYKNFCDLCNINSVIIFLWIPFSIVLFAIKFLRLDLILVELPAHEDHAGLLESSCSVCEIRGKSSFFDLVAVAA